MSSSAVIPPTPSQEAYAVDEDQGDVFTKQDPFELFADWLAQAVKSEPNDANAMSVATVDADGMPDVRVVLLKEANSDGLSFYTNRESAKGAQIAANPNAALCFHWKTLRRQVRFRGVMTEISSAEADRYFETRARGARLGAWASAQSRPLESIEALKARAAEFDEKFADQDVPRPDYWTGYRLAPQSIEFWVNRPFRLHDRLVYERDDAGAPWRTHRLNP